MPVSDVKAAGLSAKRVFMIGFLIILILLVIFALSRFLRDGVEDVSGVWKSSQSSLVYVLDKIDSNKLDYRLTVSGKRLLVESVDANSSNEQLSLTVRTESGLKAIWTFTPNQQEGVNTKVLKFDQDGLFTEELIFQRALTQTDKTRISHLKPNKKVLWSPAFNCAKAVTDVERLICTDRSLAAMDVELSKRVTASPNTNTKATQVQWLKEVRDACTDLSCLRDAYQIRLETIVQAEVEVEEAEAATEETAPEPAMVEE